MRPMRLIMGLAVLVAALAFAGGTAASTRALEIDRGVVQSVSPTTIVLRELDGSSVALAVAPSTRIRVNGFAATLADIDPGFVAAVTHDGNAPAVLIRAFGRPTVVVDRGRIVSFAVRRLTIRAESGQTLTFRVTARTRILWRGVPATRAALRPGRFAVVSHTPAGEALRVAVRPRRLL
jgi:hypothetical protein